MYSFARLDTIHSRNITSVEQEMTRDLSTDYRNMPTAPTKPTTKVQILKQLRTLTWPAIAGIIGAYTVGGSLPYVGEVTLADVSLVCMLPLYISYLLKTIDV